MAVSTEGKRRHSREGICAFLSFVPVLGSFGFFYMYHHSGRKQYKNLGILYAALSGFGMLLFLNWVYTAHLSGGNLFSAFRWLVFDLDPKRSGYTSVGVMARLGALPLVLFIYLACIVHTMLAREDYLKYMEQAVCPYRSDPALFSDRTWKRDNQLWLVMCFIPLFNGIALHFVGWRVKKKRIAWVGIILILVSLLLFITMQCFYSYGNSFSYAIGSIIRDSSNFPVALWLIEGNSVTTGMFLLIVHFTGILLAFMFRQDYLHSVAQQWLEDTQASPNYANREWRRANSGWQIWTFLPLIGGIGTFRGGMLSKNKRLIRNGIILLAINMVVLIFTLMGVSGYNSAASRWINGFSITDDSYIFLRNVYALLLIFPQRILLLLWGLSIYMGCLYRRTVLLGRASTLGQYSSDLEREIASQKRYHERSVSGAAKARQEAASPPSGQIVDAASDPGPTALLDINTCTSAELSSLPGITLADARRAVAYREEHHGFSSVDEFVDKLAIKPHFAVQIFKLATASPIQPADSPTAKAAGGHRRSIDL